MKKMGISRTTRFALWVAILATGLAILLAIGAAGLAVAVARQQLQPASQHLRGMIEDLSTQGDGFSIEFAQPLTGNERRRDFTTEPLRVGDDYFCFGEPWNNGLRWHCTPFTNIISVTFLE